MKKDPRYSVYTGAPHCVGNVGHTGVHPVECRASSVPEIGRDKIVCSCGNIIAFGTLRPGPGTREVREHPACGREPVRFYAVRTEVGDAIVAEEG